MAAAVAYCIEFRRLWCAEKGRRPFADGIAARFWKGKAGWRCCWKSSLYEVECWLLVFIVAIWFSSAFGL